MAIKVGVNGFGRMGRLAVRILAQKGGEFDIKGINLRNSDAAQMAYMLKYDSVFGRFPGVVEAGENALIINGKTIPIFGESDIANIPWGENECDYVIESTGAFNTVEKIRPHLDAGAKKVILTAPSKDKVMPTFVMGVNHMEYKPEYDIVSNASCTTNCLAPLAKVVNDNFGIVEGLMTTIHSTTSKQKTVDARAGKDWRVARSVINNIIPSTTGAAKATALVIPSLEGRLTGMSVRVPTSDVSMVDLTVKLEKSTTYEEICEKMKEASETYLKGVLAYTNEPIVSTDLIGETHTCIFDEQAGIMLNSTFVKLIAWYDNEYGYSNKVVDLVKHVHDVCEGV